MRPVGEVEIERFGWVFGSHRNFWICDYWNVIKCWQNKNEFLHEMSNKYIYIFLGIILTCLCSFHFNYSTSISGHFSIIEGANPYSHFYWRHYASDFKEWMDTYWDLNCNYHNMVISKNWIDNQVKRLRWKQTMNIENINGL